MSSSSEDSSFWEHLEALRSVLVKILLLLAISCLPGWYFSNTLLKMLLQYAAPQGFTLHYFTVMEPFFTRLKIMFTLSVCLSLPGILWFIWDFIAPAVSIENRKRLLAPFFSILLAVLGGSVSILFIVPSLVRFSLSFAGPEMQPVIGISDFISMILMVIFAGMILFQLPLIQFGLLSLGLFNQKTIRTKRPHIVVAIFVLAGIFSPPDVLSQVLLAVPCWLLFELSLLIYSIQYRKHTPENNHNNDFDDELQ